MLHMFYCKAQAADLLNFMQERPSSIRSKMQQISRALPLYPDNVSKSYVPLHVPTHLKRYSEEMYCITVMHMLAIFYAKNDIQDLKS